MATGLSKGWEAYVPANQLKWYQPDGVASTTPFVISTGVGHQDLVLQTGVGARSIWYAAANTYEAYFVYPPALKNSKRVGVFRDFLVGKAREWQF